MESTTIPSVKLSTLLLAIGACGPAIEWAVSQESNNLTIEQIWYECNQPSWMLWLIRKLKCATKEQAVRIACSCARLVLPLVPEGELRPLNAINAAEDYMRGQITLEELRKACADAAAYAYAAAYAAADAAYAAAEAAYAAAAADAAAYAAEAAYAADAGQEMKKQCAAIIRAEVSFDVVMNALVNYKG